MNKAQAQALSADIRAALKAVCDKHNLDLAKVAMTFSGDDSAPHRCTLTLSSQEVKENRVKQGSALLGTGVIVEPGTKVTLAGMTCTVVDYKPRNYKMPWIVKASNGKLYKFTEVQMQAAIKAK
jgi:hypothetical protein